MLYFVRIVSLKTKKVTSISIYQIISKKRHVTLMRVIRGHIRKQKSNLFTDFLLRMGSFITRSPDLSDAELRLCIARDLALGLSGSASRKNSLHSLSDG